MGTWDCVRVVVAQAWDSVRFLGTPVGVHAHPRLASFLSVGAWVSVYYCEQGGLFLPWGLGTRYCSSPSQAGL